MLGWSCVCHWRWCILVGKKGRKSGLKKVENLVKKRLKIWLKKVENQVTPPLSPSLVTSITINWAGPKNLALSPLPPGPLTWR